MFSLTTLNPNHEPFDLGNGVLIYFRNRQDFDFQEVAAWERITRGLSEVAKMREKANSEELFARAQKKNDSLCKELITLVLPDLPSEIFDSLTAGQIDGLASMCIQAARGDLRGRAPTASELAEAKAKFPNLPESFINSLTRGQIKLLMADDDAENDETAVNPTKRRRVPVAAN